MAAKEHLDEEEPLLPHSDVRFMGKNLLTCGRHLTTLLYSLAGFLIKNSLTALGTGLE